MPWCSPIKTQYFEQHVTNQIRATVGSMHGCRNENEDAHCIQMSLAPNHPNTTLVAVFDGHSGAAVSTRLSQELAKLFQNDVVDIDDTTDITSKLVNMDRKWTSEWTSQWKDKLSLSEWDTKKSQEVFGANAKPVYSYSYSQYMSGSTCVFALLTPVKPMGKTGQKRSTKISRKGQDTKIKTKCIRAPLYNVLIGNIGDSGCSVVRSNGSIETMTTDHKPNTQLELDRIHAVPGGYVLSGRVNGELAVSRAFGDVQYKNNSNVDYTQQAVVCTPDWTRCTLSLGDTLVLYCDGLTERLDTEAMLQYWFNGYSTSHLLGKPAKAATYALSKTMDYALESGSTDNMTIMSVEIGNIDVANIHEPGQQQQQLHAARVCFEDHPIPKHVLDDFLAHNLSVEDAKALISAQTNDTCAGKWKTVDAMDQTTRVSVVCDSGTMKNSVRPSESSSKMSRNRNRLRERVNPY